MTMCVSEASPATWRKDVQGNHAAELRRHCHFKDMQNKTFPVRRDQQHAGTLASDQSLTPVAACVGCFAYRSDSQNLIRAGIRDNDSEPTSAFLSARLAANKSSRRELGATVGRVVRPRQASRISCEQR
jgi:hypothetical protein